MTGSIGKETSTIFLLTCTSHENSNVSFDSLHYFNQKCGDVPPYPTITDLLSPTTLNKTVSFFTTALADAQGLTLAVNATNSYCHGGRQGVSNVFASALWATDYAFIAAKQGVRRLNFLGVPNNPPGNSSGITLGGAAIASDGTWTSTTLNSVPVSGANSSITVPAGSAVEITYM